ncbi:MAG: septum formation protein Maf [Bacteroidia bacterium]|nr:septum formation protein Maf [Bacteroidia bacterium]
MTAFFQVNPELPEVDFLLGSKSPRRRELLSMLDIDAEIVHIGADEEFPSDLTLRDVAQYLAEKKSNAYGGDLTGKILITSDTTVLLEDQILNKPQDMNEAKAMLRELSGKNHFVNTGVCLRTASGISSFSDLTIVTFKELSESEIDYYVNTYKPFDKAGGYGIQEWIGAAGVVGIEGCYYNVMGLPTQKLYSELCDFIRRYFQ